MSNITKDGIEVKPRQIWRDLDKRMRGREVCVLSVENGKALMLGSNNRKVRVSVNRMHYHSTGFELVGEPGSGACASQAPTDTPIPQTPKK